MTRSELTALHSALIQRACAYMQGNAPKGGQALLADELGLARPYMREIFHGEKPFPVAHAARLEIITKGVVKREELFPETWADFWPELVKRNKKQRVEA